MRHHIIKLSFVVVAVLILSSCESTQNDVSRIWEKTVYNHGRKAGG